MEKSAQVRILQHAQSGTVAQSIGFQPIFPQLSNG
jgi:hypothetical protein